MNTQNSYEVLWDGTRQRGAYLLVEPEVPQAAPRPTGSAPARHSLRGRVIETLVEGPATMRALAATLGVEINAVNGSLFALRNEGTVRVRGFAWNPRRFRREQLYALVGASR